MVAFFARPDFFVMLATCCMWWYIFFMLLSSSIYRRSVIARVNFQELVPAGLDKLILYNDIKNDAIYCEFAL